MSMQYVRDCYGVPAKRGGRVMFSDGRTVMRGTITRATHRVYIRWDGDSRAFPYHPRDERLTYLKERGE